jgi:hypothetical protein
MYLADAVREETRADFRTLGVEKDSCVRVRVRYIVASSLAFITTVDKCETTEFNKAPMFTVLYWSSTAHSRNSAEVLSSTPVPVGR